MVTISPRRDRPYPFASNRRHYYEDLDRFPDRLVIVGDAVASYNPKFGQGMSVAAFHPLVLHQTLTENGLGNPAIECIDDGESIVDPAWMLAFGADFRFPETTGPKPRGTCLLGWYLSPLTRKAHTDSELSEHLLRDIVMKKPLAR